MPIDKMANIESIPQFTTPAAKLWAAIPADTRKMLLSNVWCGKCRHEVTIANFSGAVKAGDLLLVCQTSPFSRLPDWQLYLHMQAKSTPQPLLLHTTSGVPKWVSKKSLVTHQP